MNIEQSNLEALIEKLVGLGESEVDLAAWKVLWPLMTEEEQKDLILNLQEELNQLEGLKET